LGTTRFTRSFKMLPGKNVFDTMSLHGKKKEGGGFGKKRRRRDCKRKRSPNLQRGREFAF